MFIVGAFLAPIDSQCGILPVTCLLDYSHFKLSDGIRECLLLTMGMTAGFTSGDSMWASNVGSKVAGRVASPGIRLLGWSSKEDVCLGGFDWGVTVLWTIWWAILRGANYALQLLRQDYFSCYWLIFPQ